MVILRYYKNCKLHIIYIHVYDTQKKSVFEVGGIAYLIDPNSYTPGKASQVGQSSTDLLISCYSFLLAHLSRRLQKDRFGVS